MQAFEPTEEQRKVIEHRGRHLLVFAGPGTGKTETLARRFASIVCDDGVAAESILVLTFSRRAAASMRQRIVQRLRERSGRSIAVAELHVYTFHSFCARLLTADRPRDSRRDLLTPVKERLIWNRVIDGLALKTFTRDVVASTAFATSALNTIARLKGDGVSLEAFAREARGDARLLDIAHLYRLIDEQRTRLGLSDYRDFVVDAVRELEDERSTASTWLRARQRFRHILVDEFQDSDHMQLRLLEVFGGSGIDLTPPTPEMCFVGDFNQSIYRFRGAEPKNIDAAKERFQCAELTLRVNRRSVQAVLDVANMTPHLQRESLTTAEGGNTRAGSVRLLQAETMDAEVGAIADAVAQQIASGTAPSAIAVLLRVVEPYRGALVREFQARGIPVAAQSTAGFHEDSLVDAVLSCIRVLGDREDPARWRRFLTNPLVGFRPLAVGLALSAGAGPQAAFEANPPDGRLAWPTFMERFEQIVEAAHPGRRFDPARLIETIVRELDLLWPVRDSSDVPGFDLFASPARLAALINAAHDIRQMTSSFDNGRMDAAGFLDALAPLVSLLGDPYEGPQGGVEGVPVMSIHAAKGLEFDMVVVPQLVDGVLPARARLDPLFGTRTPPYVRSADDAALEEASLWYVAVTRARYDVLATYARLGDDAAEQPLSPFALLIPSPAKEKSDDGAAPMVTRLEPAGFASAYAASSERERAAPQVMRYIDERPVLAAFVRSSGLVDEPPRPVFLDVARLSPSGIETYVQCPRKWFYNEAMRLKADDDESARMGRFVHRVLERYHSAISDFSSPRPDLTVDSVAASLDPIVREEATRVATEGGISTESPMFRYELRRIQKQLRAYARWLIDEAHRYPFVIIACERRVEIDLGDVTLVGRVDRIDRLADGTLVVRDYKSGRLHEECADAVDAAMKQLQPSVPGLGLFGNAPDGLKFQTFLYVRGVEAMMGARVSRADYLYLAGESKEDDAIFVDSIELVDASKPTNGSTRRGSSITRSELDLIYDEIATSVAREASTGVLAAFPTAIDDKTCRYCAFKLICPGPGTVTYDFATAAALGNVALRGTPTIVAPSEGAIDVDVADDVGPAKVAHVARRAKLGDDRAIELPFDNGTDGAANR